MVSVSLAGVPCLGIFTNCCPLVCSPAECLGLRRREGEKGQEDPKFAGPHGESVKYAKEDEDIEEPVERLLWGTDWVGEESAVMRGREWGRMGEAVDEKA